jgi:membrane protein
MNHFVEQQSSRIAGVAEAAATRARRVPGISVIEQTLRAYSEDRGSLTAAALSYYTLLSLFPLMLFILAISSQFLSSEEAIRQVTRFVGSYLPSSPALLRSSLQEITSLRGPLTVVAAGGFLWSASGVFDLIQLGLNRAFCVQQLRPLWRQRLVSMAMVMGVSLLFGLSFLMTTALRLAIHYGVLPRHDPVVDILPPVTTILLGFLVFGLLYRYIPYDPGLRWRDVWLSAVLASLLWEGAKLGFAWYLTNLALLNLVYGSVGTIIAVMLWGYITAAILILGAELAAVQAGARTRMRTGKEWWAAIAREPTQGSLTFGNDGKHD